MSVEVIETTDGIASWAMSAKEGAPATAACARGVAASRWASERGVMFTELATTIPKTTAAAIRAVRERARFVFFSIRTFYSSFQVPWRDNEGTPGGPPAFLDLG